MFNYLVEFLVFFSSFLIFYSLLEKGKIFSRSINLLISFIAAVYVSYIVTIYSTKDLSLTLAFSFLIFLLVFFFALLWRGFRKK